MTRRKPIPGRWYVEDDKGVRLYCVGVSDGHVDLSYRPGDPIAVWPRLEDFALFFTLLPAEKPPTSWDKVLKPAF